MNSKDWSDWVDAHRCGHRFFCWFCPALAHYQSPRAPTQISEESKGICVFSIRASSWDHVVLITKVTSEGSGEPANLRSLATAFAVCTHEVSQYGSRQKVQPKIGHLVPLDGCVCASEEWVYGGQKSAIISWAGSLSYQLIHLNLFLT